MSESNLERTEILTTVAAAARATPVPAVTQVHLRPNHHPWLGSLSWDCGFSVVDSVDPSCRATVVRAVFRALYLGLAGATASVDGSSDWSCTATFRMAPTVTTVS